MQKDGGAVASPARFFGAEVREARKRVGMSQPELAAIAGYDPSYVSKVENGAITPDQKFINACDTVFPDLHGWFVRFWMNRANGTPPTRHGLRNGSTPNGRLGWCGPGSR